MSDQGAKLKRRGLIAGAAALAAGLIAARTPEPVSATPGGMSGTPLIIDAMNTYATGTYLTPPNPTFFAGAAPAALISAGTTNGFGLYGSAGGGVFTRNAGTPNEQVYPTAGVFGEMGSNGGVGVLGLGGIVGISQASGGIAISGTVDSSGFRQPPGNGGVGVYGSTGEFDGNGVRGEATRSPGTGVVGIASTTTAAIFGQNGTATNKASGTGAGVQGQSTAGHGLIGVSDATDGHASIYGYAASQGSIAVRGSVAPANASAPYTFAGVFDGNVYISGSLSIGGNKSTAVPYPDGSQRLVYSIESPESWFEDVGSGKLANGQANVNLDPDFAAIVHTDAYLVFLTPEGENNGLYVTNKTPGGFTVREGKGGTSSLTFSWRVTARRKDIQADRRAKSVAPKTANVTSPKLPDPPTLPKSPSVTHKP